MRDQVMSAILDNKIIAIIRGIYGKDCRNLISALVKGGINLIEVTFDQANPESFKETQAAIEMINSDFENVYVGAGTVTDTMLVQMANDAGAKYIISPNVDVDVIKKTRDLGLVSIPGAMTPTEIRYARMSGADFVKVFPISNLGGATYIKAVSAPLNNIPLLGVGGVNESNINELIKAGAKGAGVGGNLVNKKWIAESRFDEITTLAEKFCSEVRR